ncbi:Uncharacterized protein TCAP_00161 [Tolypocladium capitatum]|uniref:N-acetyltransferase B complex, non-catalytic subunit n=1 Tax=Tolypocladium capitatum TaxID=45235 RepID=A0A2K3QQY2_9HYPO|nr:Uncharacterized protein TCAP_00161 [Tolypocladium capitatum]
MGHQRPRLRNGVDPQLQSAFQDGNWSVVVRLAEKRVRTLNEQYFEICAESQLDDPNVKFAAVAAVWQYVKDGTIVEDVDAIDLLEWATLDLIHEDDYAQTLGPLRVKAVKASPRDSSASTRCLQSCLLHWDLVSAQQVQHPVDNRYCRHNRQVVSQREGVLVLEHCHYAHAGGTGAVPCTVRPLYADKSPQTSPQSPPEKRKLYGTLAQKQMERAAQLTEQARTTAAEDEPPQLPSRSVQSEEEILLLYDVVETHGTASDFEKLLASPVFSPVSQFRLGRKELFLRVAARHQLQGDWEGLFNLCNDCLSDADEDGEPTLLAADWLVWRHFIDAASHLKSVNPDNQKLVQDVLLSVAKSKNLRPIYRRNVLLARVSAAFDLGAGDEDDLQDGRPSSLRIRELSNYVEDQKSSLACFDDIKGFVERLDASAIKHMAYRHIPRLADASPDGAVAARVRLLSLKLQYFASTCPLSAVTVPGEKPRSKCAFCDAEFDTALCPSCLSGIGRNALALYQSAAKDLAGNPAAENEIIPELAMVVGFCNLRLAFNHERRGYTRSRPPLAQHLLRALFMLEHQFHLTPKHSQTSLVLVQLHLLLGSAHRSREIWDNLAVKRTIVDSLAPIFYDRLSTVSPSAISPSDGWAWQLHETLRSHYAVSLNLRMPRRLIDAFEAGKYSSIMDMPKYIENLRASCTRAMSLVEEARADRLLGQRYGELLNDARFVEIHDELRLNNAIDYGSFPSWDSSAWPPMHERLLLGPGPSDPRSHLSLLSEAFHDVLDWKPPTVYKSSAAASGTDQVFVLEMMARLGHSLSKFLGGAGSTCTPAEMLYFEAVSLLCTLIPLCTGIARTGLLPDVLSQLTESLRVSLDGLLALVSAQQGDAVEKAVSTLKSLHSVAMLRDTAVAMKLTTQWILSYNEREKERDRSGSRTLHKGVLSQVKSLESAADGALEEGKDLVEKLKDGVVLGRDFVAALKRWVFEGEVDDGLGAVIEDGTVSELVESWRSNIKGWQQVKWD